MTSHAHPENVIDLFMDELLLHDNTDDFALPLLLLDVDVDDALLTSAEVARTSPTHLQETPLPVVDPDGPMSPSLSSSSTSDTVSSTLRLSHTLYSLPVKLDTTASPATNFSLMDSPLTMCSPLPNDQRQQAPKAQTTPANSSHSSSSSSTASSSVPSLATTTAVEAKQSFENMRSMAAHKSTVATLLLYAAPVAFVSAVPPVASSATATRATAIVNDDAKAVKTKRAIRQMKNRESANKSCLRRTARLTTLMTDVAELKKKEQELRTIVAGLRAENKSLLDQNAFLRSLVTSSKQDSSSLDDHPLGAVKPLPRPAGSMVDQSSVVLHLLKNGQKKTNDEEDDQDETGKTALDTEMPTLRPGKRRAVTSKLSNTASLTVCASVFGVTVFTSYDNSAVDPGTVRGVGRVLHEVSTSCGMGKCSSEASMSQTAFVETTMRSWWHVITSFELVFGVLLNMVSFLVIMVLYRLLNRHIWRRLSK